MTLLVSMPLADPVLPNLAIEQLAATLRNTGEACDTIYGTLLMPALLPVEFINSPESQAIFTPAFYELEQAQVASEIAACVLKGRGLAPSEYEAAHSDLFIDYLLAMDWANECLRRCEEAIPEGRYEVVGFSVGFDAQKLASAALARRLKAREPNIKILFGGTGCDGDMGEAVVELFPDVDAVLQGEADLTIQSAVSALRGERPLDEVPNLVYRREGRITRSSVPEVPFTLAEVSPPDYTQFLEQRKRSLYASQPTVLLFETSRGCWWGKKHHCTFCGIKSVDSLYRSRSPADAVSHILHLAERYSPDVLYATDAILDHGYYLSVLPTLAELRHSGMHDLHLFFEIKSNVKREDVALLAAAGVRQVQPGIESFSSRSLKAMRKGASPAQQIATLKWLATYSVGALYGILVGLPGETVEDYEFMIRLIPRIHHLPPPVSINVLALHKFSPYAERPDLYGLEDVRPFEYQRIIYRVSDAALLRLCYEQDYTLAGSGAEIERAHEELRAAVISWQQSHRRGERLDMTDLGDTILIYRRGPHGLSVWHLDGVRAALYRACLEPKSTEALSRSIAGDATEHLRELTWLVEQGLVLVLDGMCLALAVSLDADIHNGRAGRRTHEPGVRRRADNVAVKV